MLSLLGRILLQRAPRHHNKPAFHTISNSKILGIIALQLVVGGYGDSQVLTTIFDEDNFTSIFLKYPFFCVYTKKTLYFSWLILCKGLLMVPIRHIRCTCTYVYSFDGTKSVGV